MGTVEADQVSLTGPLLASLWHEASVNEGSALGYVEGVLFGSLNRRTQTETADAHEGRVSRQLEIVLHGYNRTGHRCSFYNVAGEIDQPTFCKLVPDPQEIVGYFVVQDGGTFCPSLRELAVYRNLIKLYGGPGRPMVLFMMSVNLKARAPTQEFQYQCVYHSPSSTPRLRLLKCRIRNLKHDSQSEYSQFQSTPLPSLGLPEAQETALSDTFGSVPPQHVQEQEALFDQGMLVLQDLIQQLRTAELEVKQLQREHACLQEAVV